METSMIPLLSVTEADCLDHQHRRVMGAANRRRRRRSAYRASGLVLRTLKVVQLSIANFRSIKSADLQFDGHTLLVGPNNVGKSTAALNTEPKPVRHKLAFDEAEAMLTARFAAFLLEPKSEVTRSEDIALGLELLATSKAAAGLAAAARWRLWAARVREGREPRAGFVRAVAGVIDAVREAPFTGDPARDWSLVKRVLRDSGDQDLLNAAKSLDYLVAFNRGRRIAAGLGAIWARDGRYTDAREALDIALAQDQILGGVDDPPGCRS
jgi:DNA helicase-2/ATP-dependent DNA helicase PcrA